MYSPKILQPTTSYDDAMTRITALQARDDDRVNPICGTIAMTHNQKVEHAVVFFHGYTNCPEQFRTLGEMLYNKGYNVLIPRMPYNGMADRMSEDHRHLTMEALKAWGNEAVDIAQGLGEQVTAAGISAGGVLSAWLAETRHEVTKALVIAPTFSYRQIPTPLEKSFIGVTSILPNFFLWWNPKLREKNPGPQYGYPRFAIRAAANILRLSLEAQKRARETAPLAESIIVTTNPNDLLVDDTLINTIVESWRGHGAQVQIYPFSADLHIGHDIIDANQPHQQTAIIYPIIVQLITGE